MVNMNYYKQVNDIQQTVEVIEGRLRCAGNECSLLNCSLAPNKSSDTKEKKGKQDSVNQLKSLTSPNVLRLRYYVLVEWPSRRDAYKSSSLPLECPAGS